MVSSQFTNERLLIVATQKMSPPQPPNSFTCRSHVETSSPLSYESSQDCHPNDESPSSFNIQILGKSFQNIEHLSLLQQPLRQVSIGFGHVIILCENGKLLCFGRNDCGQCNRRVESLPPLSLNNSSIYGDTLDILQVTPLFDSLSSTEHQSEAMENTKQMLHHTMSVRSVHCGALHTMILCENNLIFACGSNSNGQLSIPSQVAQACGTEIEKFTRVDLSSCPLLLSSPLDSVTSSTMNRIKTLHCRFSHSGILSENGELYCCGRYVSAVRGFVESLILKYCGTLIMLKFLNDKFF